MGLIKRDGYRVKNIMVTPAYAKVLAFSTEPQQSEDLDGEYLYASIGISNSRENLKSYKNALDVVQFKMVYDRNCDDIFNQIYTKAKEQFFQDWEDDIVNEKSLEE